MMSAFRPAADHRIASWRTRTARRGRRGIAVLIVLLLLAVTLSLSYAAMRTQSTVGMIQRNADRCGSARQAAITGLSMAIKKMSRTDWGGVGSSLAGSLSTSESFVVTYTSGDPRLASSDPEQPYRVTLLSTGYAVDSGASSSVAMHRVRAVMRFIPRKVADDTTDWQTMMNYTACQWNSGNFTMTTPARIEGPVRIQATLDFDWDYDWLGDPRDRYHSDLQAMNLAGLGDYRAFSGPVTLNKSWQYYYYTLKPLIETLKVSVVDASTQTFSGMTFPTAFPTYRLYPGGKEYAVPLLPQTITNAVYQPDPDTNPAGIFFRVGSLTLGDGATLRGMVMTASGSGGSVYISGKNVAIQAVDLPPLQGTTVPIQLPAVAAAGSLQISAGASVAINGLVSAYDTFQVQTDGDTGITLTHEGKLIAQNFYFDVRSNWNRSNIWWDNQEWLFDDQDQYGIRYFPLYLKTYKGLNPVPQIVIKPSSTTVQYHWHNPSNTIYAINSADGGLRWDLLDWTENVP